MDTLKYRLQDLYRYVIPGLIVVFSILLLHEKILSVKDIKKIIDFIDLKPILAAIFSAYIIGFSIDPIGKLFLKHIINRIWKLKLHKNTFHLSRSEKTILASEFSQSNYNRFETWVMLKGMCHNCAVSFIFMVAIIIIKINVHAVNNQIHWIFMALTAFLLSILMFYRSRAFDEVAYNDLTNTVYMLNLLEKSKVAIIKSVDTKAEKNNGQQ